MSTQQNRNMRRGGVKWTAVVLSVALIVAAPGTDAYRVLAATIVKEQGDVREGKVAGNVDQSIVRIDEGTDLSSMEAIGVSGRKEQLNPGERNHLHTIDPTPI